MYVHVEIYRDIRWIIANRNAYREFTIALFKFLVE